MRRVARSTVALLLGAAVLGLVPAALAHGGDEHADDVSKQDTTSYPPSYFSHPDHRGVVAAHIGLMVLGWVFVLPVAVMLSLARSRYTLLSQTLFLAANAFGVLLGIIYNSSTPDLYPNNAHHKLGWIVTWVACAQGTVSMLGRVAGAFKKADVASRSTEERQGFIPVSQQAMEEHVRVNQPPYAHPFRLSNDSGQGTEPNTESLRSSSLSSPGDSSPVSLHGRRKEYLEEEDDDLDATLPALPRGGCTQTLLKRAAGLFSSRLWKPLLIYYHVVDRTILILGFITLSTGIATYGRFFEGRMIFTGLAHWIKGGIFFWLGLFTLGRWSGSFGEVGWAWNVVPKRAGRKWRPTAEFVESALIFTYGSTNIFLEHLGNWGGEWRAQDLEHISITVLFIGGGLCGMLIESVRIRELLNTTVTEAAHAFPDHAYSEEEREALAPPEQYRFSMNPIPALVILLLGIMMSSHHQTSMISTMVHKQWGNLLTGASFARALTYVIMYLRPPRSILPSRPPTELLTSFGLIAGGIIFMASSADTVEGMIHQDLDAMFMYTVTMGFVGLLMAWEVLVIALKGLAVHREAMWSVPPATVA